MDLKTEKMNSQGTHGRKEKIKPQFFADSSTELSDTSVGHQFLNKSENEEAQRPPKPLLRKKSAISRLDKSFWKVNVAGLSEFLESNTVYGKWFWISLLLFSAVTASYEIYKIIDNYYNTPIVTELSVTAVRKMDFPFVEICLPVSINQKYLDQHPWAADAAVAIRQSVTSASSMEMKKMQKSKSKRQGLILIMNSQKTNYPVQRNLRPKTEGVIVSIHHLYNPYSFKYINVQSGLYTKMALSAEFDEYLDVDSGPKKQPCVSDDEMNFKVFNLTYSVAACQMDCYQWETLSRCGCILAQEPRFIKTEVLEKTHFCTTKEINSCVVPNVTNDEVAQGAWEECSNQCFTSCSHWKYGVQLSTMKLYTPSFGFLSRYNITPDSLVYLQIAFTDLEYTTITQDWAMQLDGFISDFGGQVGLWTGASMVTIIQVPVMLTVLLVIYLYEKLRAVPKLRQTISKQDNL
ncbi:unnamed protein product [Soboliphyme baturini]|uniref:Amiloride-sensitive sodium channel subunit alpha n=1 Tax=Soboliphyme baturini TaxID=241478 RepID=A0A183IH39_9BILA|nr:unnamed protein product [Soboliphyme baturini]